MAPEPQVAFDASFKYVTGLVRSRREPQNYSWLIDRGGHQFYPDYFLIHTMGRSVFERFFNQWLGIRWGRFGLSYHVMIRCVDLFYGLPVFAAAPYRDWLYAYLKCAPTGMIQWTLVEFFLFMEYWMRQVLSVEFMTFTPIKNDLNERAIHGLRGLDFDINDVGESSLSASIVAACHANWLDIIVPQFASNISDVISKACSTLISNPCDGVSDDILDLMLNDPKQIMYECDNAGEIVFDLVVVSKLLSVGHRVVLVAKYGPILNDVTVDEVTHLIETTSMFDRLKSAIDQGQLQIVFANAFAVPGKYLPLVTETYRHCCNTCDIFWLKGQANFQTMPIANHGVFKRNIKYKKPIVFNFIVKSPMVGYCLDNTQMGQLSLGDPLICLV